MDMATRASPEEIQRLERNRNGGRLLVAIGVLGLFFSGAFPTAFVLVGALVVLAFGVLSWMYWGLQLRRRNDPWAYDPDVDGPDPRVRRGLEHAERESRREE